MAGWRSSPGLGTRSFGGALVCSLGLREPASTVERATADLDPWSKSQWDQGGHGQALPPADSVPASGPH